MSWPSLLAPRAGAGRVCSDLDMTSLLARISNTTDKIATKVPLIDGVGARPRLQR